MCFAAFFTTLGAVADDKPSAPDPYKNYNDRLARYADLIKAQAEYGKMLVEAKIADSKIRLNNAEAELKHTLAAALRVQIEAMQYELGRIMREDQKLEWKIAEIEKLGQCTANLSLGDSNPFIIHHCLIQFLRTYVPPSIIKEVMKVSVPTLAAAENFRANDASVIAEDFNGGNVGRLIDFLGSHEISLVRWSPAHFQVLDMMTALVMHAEIQIQKYQAWMTGIRAGTLNVWTLPRL